MDIMITKQKAVRCRKRASTGSMLSATKDGQFVIDREARQVCFIGESKSGLDEYSIDIPIKNILQIADLINGKKGWTMNIEPTNHKKVYFIWLQDNGCIVKECKRSVEIGRCYSIPARIDVFLTGWDDKRLKKPISRVPSYDARGAVNVTYKGCKYGLFYDMLNKQFFIEYC